MSVIIKKPRTQVRRTGPEIRRPKTPIRRVGVEIRRGNKMNIFDVAEEQKSSTGV